MPAVPRQRRYDQVMGDREPKITDKRFVQELQQRLENKYTTAQQQTERRLAEAESRRVRKLVLDGVVEPGDARSEAAGRDSRGAGHGRDNEWKEFWPQNPYKTLAEYDEDKRRKADEAGRQQHSEQPESQKTSGAQPASDEAPTPSAGANSDGRHEHQTEPASPSTEQHLAAGRYEGTESPRIEELMREEDLEQLYSKASEIVYIMAPPAKKQQAAKSHH